MKSCPNCNQDDGTENRSCAFCGFPGTLPKEILKWSESGDRSPDGRRLESDPIYQILAKIKERK